MIDAASGGALVDKTLEAARNLIINMTANSQQFGTRFDHPPKHINVVSVSSLEQQIASLTSLVRQIAVRNTYREEEPIEQVHVVGGFPGQP